MERLFIGAKNNNIGFLSIKNHGENRKPNSLYIKKRNGRYSVSFCYDDGLDDAGLKENCQHLAFLNECPRDFLERQIIGIDRGVPRAGESSY